MGRQQGGDLRGWGTVSMGGVKGNTGGKVFVGREVERYSFIKIHSSSDVSCKYSSPVCLHFLTACLESTFFIFTNLRVLFFQVFF